MATKPQPPPQLRSGPGKPSTPANNDIAGTFQEKNATQIPETSWQFTRSRLSRDHSFWMQVTGQMAWKARSDAGENSETPMCLASPASLTARKARLRPHASAERAQQMQGRRSREQQQEQQQEQEQEQQQEPTQHHHKQFRGWCAHAWSSTGTLAWNRWT